MNANRARDFGKLLKGTKFLIPGNHEEIFWSPKKMDRYIDGGFRVLPKQHSIYIGKYKVLLSHLPYASDEAKKYDKRYFELRPILGNEDFLLHGHEHCKKVKEKTSIDVGIDHNFRLYSEDDIIRLFEDKRTFIPSRLDGYVSKHGAAG